MCDIIKRIHINISDLRVQHNLIMISQWFDPKSTESKLFLLIPYKSKQLLNSLFIKP